MSAKLIIPVFLAALLVFGQSAAAVTLDWDDLTDSQQEQAYQKLQEENQALREKIAELEKALNEGGSGQASPADNPDANVPDQGGPDTDGNYSGLKDVDSFLADLAKSFNARQDLARTYSSDQIASMSEDETWTFRFKCAEEERALYESYKDAQFDDLNILYLCSEYCQGLGKQFRAKEIYENSHNVEEANELYTAGYYNRAYALVELCEFYGLDLASEYANLKSAVQQMDALSGDESRNAGVDSMTVTAVQELLNEAGFRCGTPDGIAGRQTASCIERFQKMYGFEPADGIIDDELIGQLNSIISRKQG